MPDGSKKDRSGEMIDGLRRLALDGLIGVGGDGSLDILRRLLAPIGLAFIGVPKTIDNDVANTERAIGYSTAVAIATEALDRLQPTGASHERVMVLEVMGRDAGHIAIAAAIAGGADVVLIPEVRWHLSMWWRTSPSLRAAGRTSALVVVAEAAGHSDEAADATATRPIMASANGWRGGSARRRVRRPAPRCWAMSSAAPCRPPRTACSPRRWACAPSTFWPTARPTAWWRGGTAR